MALLLACGPRSTDDVTVQWTINPAPAAGAATIVRVAVHDDDMHPIDGAHLQIEAHMAHPGMTPVVGSLVGRGDGIYEGDVQFSMAGDWIFVVTGELPDGRRITRNSPVSTVRPSALRPAR